MDLVLKILIECGWQTALVLVLLYLATKLKHITIDFNTENSEQNPGKSPGFFFHLYKGWLPNPFYFSLFFNLFREFHKPHKNQFENNC
jgi:hypothetical protein